MPRRHEYVLTLPSDAAAMTTPDGTTLTQLAPGDHEALAQLMLDAYRGTIDYEGETIVEARQEIDGVFDGGVLNDASLGLRIVGELVSAIVAVPWEEDALVAFVMTHPEYTGRGFAAYLVEQCVEQLAEIGNNTVHAFITEGNVASETVFLRAGFVRVPPSETSE